jgi:hypothetical protein
MAAKEEMIHAPQLQIARVQSPAHSFEQLERIAEYVAQSKMIGGIENKAQAMTLMLLSQAEGRHPLEAQQRYHMVKGRPSKKAEAMLADFIESGGNVEFHERSETRCDATFTHVSVKEPVRVTWTIDMARTAQLMGNDGWKKYPRAMLHARTVSEGVRAVYPKACHGMYTPQEVEDMDEPRDNFASLPQEQRPEAPQVIDVPKRRAPNFEGHVYSVAAPEARAESKPHEALPEIPDKITQIPASIVQANFGKLSWYKGQPLATLDDDDLDCVIDTLQKFHDQRKASGKISQRGLDWLMAIVDTCCDVKFERANPTPPVVEQ